MGIAFMPFLIPIVAILAWAAVQVSKNIGGGSGDMDLSAGLAALADEIDAAHEENARLRARVESLEAIATADTDPDLLDFGAITDDEPNTESSGARERTRA